MTIREDDVRKLARTPKCPRCGDPDKTMGTAICSDCRRVLPENMRAELENIEKRDPFTVMRAIRAAANYFDVHFQSIRNFGGGKKRR